MTEAKLKWNYRLVELANHQGFGIFEVYYNDLGEPVGMNEARFLATIEQGPEAALTAMRMAINDAERQTTFKEPKNWSEKDHDRDLNKKEKCSNTGGN